MSESSHDPFEVLGVKLEADDADVRRAYALRIREARASGDADRADRVQQAFEAIRDEENRRRVRTSLEGAGELAPLLAQAAQRLDSGELGGAREAFREILRASPRNEAALLGLAKAEFELGRHEAAATVVRRLIEVAPSDPRGWEFRAFLLFQAAASATEHGRAQDLLQTSLRHVRRAKELGDQRAAAVILESDILCAQGREMAAFQPLLSRLAQADEMRSDQLEVAVALLERAGARGHQRIFRDTLDAIARLFPPEPERRRTVAHALCAVARGLAGERPQYGIECAEFLELNAGDDPEVRALLDDVQRRKAHAEAHVERLIQAQAPLMAQQAERAASSSPRGGFFAVYRTWILGVIIFKLALFVSVFRTGCRDGQPAGVPRNVVVDQDGKVTHVIDSRGRKIPLKKRRAGSPAANRPPENETRGVQAAQDGATEAEE
jgi:tetratricopeptide (TPR) repeat protein